MGRKKRQLQIAARNRAEIVMKVRSGFLTATEGTSLLWVSRKTYYKWENRALEAMLAGLEDSSAPRTASATPRANTFP